MVGDLLFLLISDGILLSSSQSPAPGLICPLLSLCLPLRPFFFLCLYTGQTKAFVWQRQCCVFMDLLRFIGHLTYHHRRRQWQPTPVLLPGKSHGWRSLVGCSPWGHKESDRTEWLHFHFSLLCIGEGNGNPLQCSCLENPRDRGVWWAADYGVAQSWTQLKWLSSSSMFSS